MPDSDDSIEQARSQWLASKDPFANRLSQEVFKHGLPILGRVFSFWQSAERRQVLLEFNNWVLDYLKALTIQVEALPNDHKVDRTAAIAVERILWGASDKKAK